VARDLLEPLRRDIPSARDVLQERQDVVRAFGPAEGDDEEGIGAIVGKAAGGPVGGGLGGVATIASDASSGRPQASGQLSQFPCAR